MLDALARPLRLTATQHGYLLSLAGYAPAAAVDVPVVIDAPAHVQRLMDAMGDFPTYAIAPDWGIAGWNAAYRALYPNVAQVERRDRNLLWLVFTDPNVRSLLARLGGDQPTLPGGVPGEGRAAGSVIPARCGWFRG